MAQYRSIFNHSCFAESEYAPSKDEYIRAIQKDLHVAETGVMTPELLAKIDERFDAIGDAPTAEDQNFASLFQGLFDLGGMTDQGAESGLKKSLQVFARSMAGKGVSVSAALPAAGASGAQFFSAYRGVRGASGGSVIEVVARHIGINKQCASLTKALTNVGAASEWRRGEQVMGNTSLQPGTAIATFNFAKGDGDRGYGPADHPGGWYNVSHTAIYLGQNKEGLYVLDQYNRSNGAQVRFLKFGDPGAEGASRYHVINTPGHKGAHVAASLPQEALKYAGTGPIPPPSAGSSDKVAGTLVLDKPRAKSLTAHV